MLGNTLVTIQTGDAGKQVHRLYITDGADIKQEFYLAFLVDRASSRIAVAASTDVGLDIETVDHDPPQKLHNTTISPPTRIHPPHYHRSHPAPHPTRYPPTHTPTLTD